MTICTYDNRNVCHWRWKWLQLCFAFILGVNLGCELLVAKQPCFFWGEMHSSFFCKAWKCYRDREGCWVQGGLVTDYIWRSTFPFFSGVHFVLYLLFLLLSVQDQCTQGMHCWCCHKWWGEILCWMGLRCWLNWSEISCNLELVKI